MAFHLPIARRPLTAAAASSSACLGCMARWSLAAAAGRPTAVAGAAHPFAVQLRGKKQGRRGDNGVLVRLLEDIPQFGRRDTILRTDRGRMRNLWYPQRLAEYMTPPKFAALGLAPADAVAERDPWFGMGGSSAEGGEQAAAAAAAAEPDRSPSVQLQTVDAARAAALLEALLPPALVFHRKAISAPTSSSEQETAPPSNTAAIFGSVSADDVAAAVRAILQEAAGKNNSSGEIDSADDARLVRVEARDVRFVVPAAAAEAALEDEESDDFDEHATVDRVKTLGRFEVEITVRGGASGAVSVHKAVEVVAQE